MREYRYRLELTSDSGAINIEDLRIVRFESLDELALLDPEIAGKVEEYLDHYGQHYKPAVLEQ